MHPFYIRSNFYFTAQLVHCLFGAHLSSYTRVCYGSYSNLLFHLVFCISKDYNWHFDFVKPWLGLHRSSVILISVLVPMLILKGRSLTGIFISFRHDQASQPGPPSPLNDHYLCLCHCWCSKCQGMPRRRSFGCNLSWEEECHSQWLDLSSLGNINSS